MSSHLLDNPTGSGGRAGSPLVWKISVFLCAICLVQAAGPRTFTEAQATGHALPSANPRRTHVVEVVERVRPAVVNIHSERTVQGPAAEELFAHSPLQNRINGMGTGIVIDSRGYIITNHHVVEDVSVIRVRLSDRSAHTARVVARDSESDLALLKVDAGKPLPTIPIGTATDLMVGETVVAIGNAYGYEYTVTQGVVSAIKRDVVLNKEVSYKGLIQTDAAINPGNSGGPLLNINGELVGVNVAIRAGAQGISFAIPVETMIRVASNMLSIRKRNGTWHGLVVKDEIQPEDSIIKTDGGVQTFQVQRQLIVDRVESNSPAAQAGIKTGDVIVQVADMRMACSLDLERSLLDRTAGERVPVVLRRKGAEKQLEVVLQSYEKPTPVPADLVWKKLGLRFDPVEKDQVNNTSKQLNGGLLVTEVRSEGLAGKAGIQKGDILVGLHQWETLNLDNITFVLTHKDLASFNPLCFYIIRAGQIHRGWLPQVD